MARKTPVNLLFDGDQLDRIDAAAHRARMSRAEWVRRAAEAVLRGQVTLDLEPEPEEKPA